MIPLAFLTCTTGMGFVAVVLVYRLGRVNRAIDALAQGPDILGSELAELIRQQIDASLLPGTGQAGLTEIDVPYREFNDPYRNLAELLEAFTKAASTTTVVGLNQQIKHVLQIQSSLDIPFAEVIGVLRILEVRLRATSGPGSATASIEVVSPGTLLDKNKMMAINYGTYVKQPLGVVAFDSEGKDLNKAKVVCI